MAILEIARMGHPVLRRRAEEVADPTAPAVGRLVEDMIDTLEESGGVGLAAPQVAVPLRVVIFKVPAERASDDGDEEGESGVPLTVLVNPVIEPLDDEMVEQFEACLSLPDLMGRVPRHQRIRYTGVGLDGAPIAVEASGFHARVVQHECDHLDGILYPMRMSDLRTFGFVEEFRKAIAAQAAEAPSGEQSPRSEEDQAP